MGYLVMAGLVPAIHVFATLKTWMPGARPGENNDAASQILNTDIDPA
jgi:hypothetical protein